MRTLRFLLMAVVCSGCGRCVDDGAPQTQAQPGANEPSPSEPAFRRPLGRPIPHILRPAIDADAAVAPKADE